MEYDEFVALCIGSLKAKGIYHGSWRRNPCGPGYNYKGPDDFHIYVEWETGGYSGGSCWGGTPEAYTTGNPDEDLVAFDVLVEVLRPDIRFMDYRIMKGALVKSGSYSSGHDYYGNSTNTGYREVRLQDLYEYMKEKEWL